ncbi:MAG: FtsX-like permease family protein [Ruminococcaceae bacterium]|nr:FtsX-like permease family protein [Oscillospiraceae bacterium]
MNIVNTLTLRHIKSHKRRSLLTVLSIIVSVAMVTAVFTTVFSFVTFLRDATLAYDGSWQAELTYEETPDLAAFQSEDTEYYAGVQLCRFTYQKDIEKAKAYSQIDAVDEAVVKMRNIKIKEGAFPKNKGDLLITDKYIENNKLNWRVGDTVSLYCADFATEKEYFKEYKICGIAQGNVSFFDNRDGVTANADSAVSYVTLRYKTLDESFYDKAETLQKKTGAKHISYNTDLLDYSGVNRGSSTIRTVKIFTCIILAVIVFASVFMIYDSFAVSYQERERYLGMLASVGATKKQKRSSIYFEGFILGTAGTVLGIIAGFVGMAITFRSIEGAFLSTIAIPIQGTLKVHFSPYIIIGTVALSALTIFVSCYIPARRASKTTPINAIKGTNTVKVKKAKRLRVSGLTKKLYGFEGELAVKNFKRNGRRSRTIVFALVMSVVLFLSVTNFSQLFTSLVQMETGEQNADFQVYSKIEDKDEIKKYFERADIDDCVSYLQVNSTLKNTDLLTADAKSAYNSKEKSIYLFVMENERFDDYLRALGEKPEGYHHTDSLKAIIFNQVTDVSGKMHKSFPAFSADVAGKTLECYINQIDENTGENNIKHDFNVTAGAITDKEYDGRLFLPKYMNYPSIILPEDAISVLPVEQNGCVFNIFVRDYKPAMEAAESYFESKGIACEIVDTTSQIQAINAVLQIMKVFMYGFITLITLIAIINIINSVSNSMNERKTEFAMLKSVGVTPKGFKKMVYVESVRYGVKSLLWSLPLSVALHALMYYALSSAEGMQIPFSTNWQYYVAAVLAVFAIILMSLLYSADKIKDDNIIENLKQD